MSNFVGVTDSIGNIQHVCLNGEVAVLFNDSNIIISQKALRKQGFKGRILVKEGFTGKVLYQKEVN